MQRLRGRNIQQLSSSSSNPAATTTTTTTGTESKNNKNAAVNNDEEESYNNNNNNGSVAKGSRRRKNKIKKRSSSSSIAFLFSRIRLRWSLLSPWSKIALILLLIPIISIHVMVGTIDIVYQHYYYSRMYGPTTTNDDQSLLKNKNKNNNNNNNNQTNPSKEFVVVINTYKRPKQLEQAVRHYAYTCGKPAGVGLVVIVWCEQDVEPPAFHPDSFFVSSSMNVRQQQQQQQQVNEDYKRRKRRIAPVHIVKAPKNSLNSRFVPPKNFTTTSTTNAIFMVDDDIQVDCFSLQQGFRAWTYNPWSMVGYYPRLASPARSNSNSNSNSNTSLSLIEHCWPIVFLKQQVNFMLTKACFLHEHYLELYTSDKFHPKEIKDYVDQYNNCEDVAMSLLVANYTRGKPIVTKPVIYVEGARVSDAGLFNGISTKGGFVERRAACLTDLSEMYIKRGWGSPLNDKSTYNLQDIAWHHHMPGFWWQYRPSNPFEWFALLDFFK